MSRSIGWLCALFLLAGCGGERTEHLSQEVLLNTGEKIVVHWTVVYSLQGASGNPMDIKMRPRLDHKTLNFNYRGKDYRYYGGGDFFLLAISPEGRPTLVLYPGSNAWDYRHNYNKCATPYYAQLNPDDSGQNWGIPSNIEPWLYGLRGNLSGIIFGLPPSPEPRGALLTIEKEYSAGRDKYLMLVDPTYTNRDCKPQLY